MVFKAHVCIRSRKQYEMLHFMASPTCEDKSLAQRPWLSYVPLMPHIFPFRSGSSCIRGVLADMLLVVTQ